MADLIHIRAGCALFVILIQTACIGSNLDFSVQKAGALPLGSALKGVFETTESVIVDLSEPAALPTVLIFAQETCGVCIKETQLIRMRLIRGGAMPTQVHLYTVLAGADQEIARDWKQDHQVPWIVGLDPELKLFESYCPEKKTPCLLVHQPGQGIVFQHTGEMDVSRLPEITGPWY